MSRLEFFAGRGEAGQSLALHVSHLTHKFLNGGGAGGEGVVARVVVQVAGGAFSSTLALYCFLF